MSGAGYTTEASLVGVSLEDLRTRVPALKPAQARLLLSAAARDSSQGRENLQVVPVDDSHLANAHEASPAYLDALQGEY